jgi:hypothetical protein
LAGGIACAVAIFFVYASFAGNTTREGGAFGGGHYVSWEHYQHGWPTVFLTRVVYDKRSNRFALADGHSSLNSRNLLLNVLTVALIFGVTFMVLQLHLKRHGRLFRFGILELLVVFAVVGSTFGYFAYLARRNAHDHRISEQLQGMGHSCIYTYRGPLVLARVFGDRIWSKSFGGIVGINLAEDLNDDRIKAMCEVAEELSCINEISASFSNLSDEGLAYLASRSWAPEVRKISLFDTRITNVGLSSLTAFTDLREVDIASTEIGDSGIILLSRCPHLEELICNSTRITESSVAKLYEFKSLKKLSAFFTAVPDAKWKEFADKMGCEVEY